MEMVMRECVWYDNMRETEGTGPQERVIDEVRDGVRHTQNDLCVRRLFHYDLSVL